MIGVYSSLQNSRNLQLVVSRSGGTIGTIAVDYDIVYLAPGVLDPLLGTTGVVAPAMGSVQIPEGQSSLQFNIPLMSDAFLEEDSAFYASLVNATLVGGGETSMTCTLYFCFFGFITASAFSLSHIFFWQLTKIAK